LGEQPPRRYKPTARTAQDWHALAFCRARARQTRSPRPTAPIRTWPFP